MARKETVGELSAFDARWCWGGLRTSQDSGVFVRFGEVYCPLGTKKVWHINQFALVQCWGPTKYAQRLGRLTRKY